MLNQKTFIQPNFCYRIPPSNQKNNYFNEFLSSYLSSAPTMCQQLERSHLFHKKLSNYNFIWLRNNDCMKNNFYEPMLSGLLIVGSLRTHLFALFDHFLWLIFVSFFCWCYGKREQWIILLSYNSKKQRKKFAFCWHEIGLMSSVFYYNEWIGK